MRLSNIIFLAAPLLQDLALAAPHTEKLPTTCPLPKLCAWGWGEMYQIYESQPNLTVARQYYTGETFEVSQSVRNDRHGNKKVHNRIYTLMHLQFMGLGSGGCTINFDIPCNSSTPFHHHGPISNGISVRKLTWPFTPPTWNNIVNAPTPLIGTEVLGTFGSSFKRNTFETVTGDVCQSASTGDLAFVFSVDEGVGDSAGARWNQTLINDSVVVGAFVNFTC